MTDLHRLNDDLAALAFDHGVTRQHFRNDEVYDEWLDNLTHLVAEQLDAEY